MTPPFLSDSASVSPCLVLVGGLAVWVSVPSSVRPSGRWTRREPGLLLPVSLVGMGPLPAGSGRVRQSRGPMIAFVSSPGMSGGGLPRGRGFWVLSVRGGCWVLAPAFRACLSPVCFALGWVPLLYRPVVGVVPGNGEFSRLRGGCGPSFSPRGVSPRCVDLLILYGSKVARLDSGSIVRLSLGVPRRCSPLRSRCVSFLEGLPRGSLGGAASP